MSLLFLIPLATALGAAYIFETLQDEVAILAAVAVVVSVILCLVLSPWQLQLSLLMVVLLTTRRVSLKNSRF